MGGGSDKASKAAQRQEAARQERIKGTTRRIDAIYDSPDRVRQYDDFARDLLGNFTLDANRQKAVADRNLKFAMARSGNTGGSVAVDAGRTLRDEYTRGILAASQRAQAGASDLRTSDQQARLNLIQLANSGTDTTSAAANAAAAMRSSLEGARSQATATGLGDIFANTGNIYARQQEAAERRRAMTMPLGGGYYGRT